MYIVNAKILLYTYGNANRQVDCCDCNIQVGYVCIDLLQQHLSTPLCSHTNQLAATHI